MFAYECAICFNVSLKMLMSGLNRFYIPLNKLVVFEIWTVQVISLWIFWETENLIPPNEHNICIFHKFFTLFHT
jgi:hypothetical protein